MTPLSDLPAGDSLDAELELFKSAGYVILGIIVDHIIQKHKHRVLSDAFNWETAIRDCLPLGEITREIRSNNKVHRVTFHCHRYDDGELTIVPSMISDISAFGSFSVPNAHATLDEIRRNFDVELFFNASRTY